MKLNEDDTVHTHPTFPNNCFMTKLQYVEIIVPIVFTVVHGRILINVPHKYHYVLFVPHDKPPQSQQWRSSTVLSTQQSTRSPTTKTHKSAYRLFLDSLDFFFF